MEQLIKPWMTTTCSARTGPTSTGANLSQHREGLSSGRSVPRTTIDASDLPCQIGRLVPRLVRETRYGPQRCAAGDVRRQLALAGADRRHEDVGLRSRAPDPERAGELRHGDRRSGQAGSRRDNCCDSGTPSKPFMLPTGADISRRLRSRRVPDAGRTNYLYCCATGTKSDRRNAASSPRRGELDLVLTGAGRGADASRRSPGRAMPACPLDQTRSLTKLRALRRGREAILLGKAVAPTGKLGTPSNVGPGILRRDRPARQLFGNVYHFAAPDPEARADAGDAPGAAVPARRCKRWTTSMCTALRRR